MIGKILARISESRFCPNNLFFYHTVLGLEFDVFNEKCLARKLSNIIFEKINQDSLNSSELDHLLDELISVTGADCVPAQREIFRTFFENGRMCFVARKFGALIGYYWAFLGNHVITYDDYKKKNLKVILPPDMIFFGNGYIHPFYRFKGVFPHFAKYCIEYFPKNNRTITATDIENYASFNAHTRLGYKKQFQLTCVSFGHLQLYIIKSANGKTLIDFHLHTQDKEMPQISADKILPAYAELLQSV